jgi:signal transduction histidine kinase
LVVTGSFVLRRTTLSVGRRLFLGLLPAMLAIVLAVGLAYYGEYGRAAPNVIVVAASVLAIASFAMTWINTRYLSERIARLTNAISEPGSPDHVSGQSDEFDRIERAVGDLGTALSASNAELAHATAAADSRLRDEATMLAGVVHDTSAQLDELRLPLHILLDARFGELNENQEELLRDARAAADAISGALRQLALLADADRGALPVQRESVQVNDVVRSILPLARAAAERRGSRVDVSLEPGLPRVLADRARLAEALALVVADQAPGVGPDNSMVVETSRANDAVVIGVRPAVASAPSILACRLIEAQGGSVVVAGGGIVVRVGGSLN